MTKKPLVIGDYYSLPFSRGILARSLEVVGTAPDVSYSIATDIQDRLVKENIKKISRDRLREITYNQLKTHAEADKAEKFIRFRKIKKNINKPLIILLGGSTGSGKSTISVDLAHRLDITTVITTDIIREIMRSMISPKLMPSLHQSSYTGWKKLDIPVETDHVILGFKQQAAKINVGVKGIIERAVGERRPVIINGVHLLPNLLRPRDFPQANIFMAFTYIQDEEEHKQRFHYRDQSGEYRKASRYIKYFPQIRQIQDHVIQEARKMDIPCMDNMNMRLTSQWIIDQIIERFSDEDELQ